MGTAELKASTKPSSVEKAELAEILDRLTLQFGVNLEIAQRNSPIIEPLRHSGGYSSGVTVGEVHAPPLLILNRPTPRSRKNAKFVAYYTDEPHDFVLGSGAKLRAKREQIMFLDTSEPWELRFGGRYTLNCIAVDKQLIEGFDHVTPMLTGQSPIRHQIGRLFGDFIRTSRSIWMAGELEQSISALQKSFRGLIELAKLSSQEIEEACHGNSLSARRQQIKSFIDANFSSPNLSIGLIATQLRISSRYVQMAFASEGTSPGEYIRRCRLEASAMMLLDQRSKRASVTEIAFQCGFSSSSHFSTQFKAEFGQSPKDFRLQRLYY